MTSNLQYLFGPERVFNFPIKEVSIVGTAIGRAISGETPIVELQFGPYGVLALDQIIYQLGTLRWRSAGQFDAGMVIRIQDMNRIGGDGISKAGGIGGIGHGSAEISRYQAPGLIQVIPGDATEVGPLLMESIRVARSYRQPVLFWESISLLNAERGYDQGAEAHIPLGVPELRKSGEDLTIITWSNNVKIADEASSRLEKEGIHAGVINTRTLTPSDWSVIESEVDRIGKVLIFEAGRGADSQYISEVISTHFWHSLDAPVARLTAKNIPMPAGEENEAFTVPQLEDVLTYARRLHAW